jgi:hypothetical protein
MSEDEYQPKASQAPPFVPPVTVPDTLKVPPNTIMLVSHDALWKDPKHYVKPPKQRKWFTPYFYHCLPLVMGNQHGFMMLTDHSFVARWNGGPELPDLTIHHLNDKPSDIMFVDSHFGSGIITVQSRWMFRTPKGVSLMVKAPPNYYVHGLSWMDAVVETDNLRRDFTFNIKVTQPNTDIFVEAGTPVGCIVPYPRYFHDPFELMELKDAEELKKAQLTSDYFGTERSEFDTLGPRHRYMEGIDIYNIPFDEHQKSLDGGKWWKEKKAKGELPSKQEAEATPPTAKPWWKKFLG